MSEPSLVKAVVYKPPSRPDVRIPSVILYGAILSYPATDWQTCLAALLADLPIAILNPRRDDWDSTWIEDISFPKFREQVDWEMDYAAVADVIVFYFAPSSPQPVTLLELGMYAATKRAIVCCPPGFHKRGNIQIVCHRYGIDFVETLEELSMKVRARLVQVLSLTTLRQNRID